MWIRYLACNSESFSSRSSSSSNKLIWSAALCSIISICISLVNFVELHLFFGINTLEKFRPRLGFVKLEAILLAGSRWFGFRNDGFVEGVVCRFVEDSAVNGFVECGVGGIIEEAGVNRFVDVGGRNFAEGAVGRWWENSAYVWRTYCWRVRFYLSQKIDEKEERRRKRCKDMLRASIHVCGNAATG